MNEKPATARKLHQNSLAAIAGLGVVGALLLWGAPWPNGDAVVYAEQALSADFKDRTVHIGYVLVVYLVQMIWPGDALALLQLLNLTALLVGLTALASRMGPASAVPVLGVGSVALVTVPIAEVDLVWWSLVCVAWSSGGWKAGAAAAAAVTVSPVAIPALLWAIGGRRHARWILGGMALSVLLLSLVGPGSWWVGERGVWKSDPADPWRTLLEWRWFVPWLLLPMVRDWRGLGRDLLILSPLLWVPADVPTWVMPATAVGARVAAEDVRRWGWLVVGQVLLSVGLATAERERIATEWREISTFVEQVQPGDGVIAPWSFGVRISLLRSNTAYESLWRTPGSFVRDQNARWCAADPDAVWRFGEPGQLPSDSVEIRQGCP